MTRLPAEKQRRLCAHAIQSARPIVETFVGAHELSEKLGLKLKSPRERSTLREVVRRLGGKPEAGWVPGDDDNKLRVALNLALEKAEVLKPAGSGDELGVTKETMVEWTGLSEKEFHEIFLSWIDVETTYFQLYKRDVHVFSEALRILEFRDVCARSSNDVSGTSPEVLKELGALMNASMESCSKIYECACPELDQLCKIAMDAGAYGSRLTGAGWGGCTVSLVDEENVEPFIEALKEHYPAYKGLEGEALSEIIFATKPSAGACVFKLEEY